MNSNYLKKGQAAVFITIKRSRFLNCCLLLNFLLLIRADDSAGQTDSSHYVPVNKQLSTAWEQSLLFSNNRKPFTGNQLTTIGMPCGGIASGQLYVRGDGTLAGWWIANNAYNTGYGIADKLNFNTALGPWKVCYQSFEPMSYIEQGFTIAVDKNKPRPLDKAGFNNIAFTGEYPVAGIDYADNNNPLPLQISLQVYSPFIPLDARSSATPATVMQYTIKNTGNVSRSVTLVGKLQNLVGLDASKTNKGASHNKVIHSKSLTSVTMDLINTDLPVMHPWNGNIALSLLSDKAVASASDEQQNEAIKPLGDPLVGTVGETISLNQANQEN